MQKSRRWAVRQSWRITERLQVLLGSKSGVHVDNEAEIFHALHTVFWTKPTGDYANPLLPPDFVIPQLHMPKHGFAPDYLVVGQTTIASSRLREALAQPSSAVQYFPIDIHTGGVDARAQDYRWINVLACHPAINMADTRCQMKEGINYQTGETFRFIQSYNSMVIRDDIDPNAELFRVAEDLTTVLASDALAERVLRAGCTGIAFEDPTTYLKGGSIHRYRTSTGIEEEDMDKIFPETP